ncbi:hypothetical protein XM38_043780 [Halomicronema hongdechloris C2206]|uniref:Uncharacterized protein n=1 Tax=Halomicronema hongdechloris C2206 TaxID=1641165 RepID=A0A1Z3HSW4_9CYAN|nr:hypothetical protein [Halomicronema hongdechloris]ASC73411.1 hypothetical protein XM38_043780 [Halomicronema hongdechloris C2206]
MIESSLAHLQMASSQPQRLREQVQIALAIADASTLRSLLTESTPPLALSDRIGVLRAEVGVPLPEGGKRAMDGVLWVESIECALAGSRPDLAAQPSGSDHQPYQDLTRCHSELHTLAQNISLSEAIALLSHAGFQSEQISQILHLPAQAWHRDWWYQSDLSGHLTLPFCRAIRTRRFADGRFSLQYRDFYALEPPPCFQGIEVAIPVEFKPADQGFGETLERVNGARRHWGTDKALVISETLSELEVQGLTRQGVSLYQPRPQALPQAADCSRCHQANCPLQGRIHSPVLTCQSYDP